jgi:hypothetical protein
MLVALMAFGLSFPTFKGPPPCPPDRYMACPDTHRLARNVGFQQALHRFVGEAHGAYLHGDKPLYGQVIQLISTQVQPPKDLGGGAMLFAGCKFLSCPEKAAVIVDRYGVLAIGILNYRSGSDPDLDVIVRRPDAATPARAEILKTWAQSAVSKDSSLMHTAIILRKVRLRSLDAEEFAPRR